MGLLVQTLAADEKYPVLKRENLTTPIQMQLSQKENTFPQFLAAFLKSNLYLEYFQKKKNNPHRFCISEITDSKTESDKCLKSPVSEDSRQETW